MTKYNVEILRTLALGLEVEVDSDDPGEAMQAVLDFARQREVGDPIPDDAPRWQYALARDDFVDWDVLDEGTIRVHGDDGIDLVEPADY